LETAAALHVADQIRDSADPADELSDMATAADVDQLGSLTVEDVMCSVIHETASALSFSTMSHSTAAARASKTYVFGH
jgi:hypothetical protein